MSAAITQREFEAFVSDAEALIRWKFPEFPPAPRPLPPAGSPLAHAVILSLIAVCEGECGNIQAMEDAFAHAMEYVT